MLFLHGDGIWLEDGAARELSINIPHTFPCLAACLCLRLNFLEKGRESYETHSFFGLLTQLPSFDHVFEYMSLSILFVLCHHRRTRAPTHNHFHFEVLKPSS